MRVLLSPGIRLGPGLSLHNQGVVEQEHVNLVIVGTGELVSPLTSVGGSVSCGGTRSNPASPAPVAEDKRQSISSMVEGDSYCLLHQLIRAEDTSLCIDTWFCPILICWTLIYFTKVSCLYFTAEGPSFS